MTLPHDWSIAEPFDPQWASAMGFLPGGIGCYRKTFTLPETATPRMVFLHFDGIYCNSEVWINGHFLGKRPSGFASFRYDLTTFLKSGGENTVAVRADHSRYADARWYTGSGIYRNVYLIQTDPIRIRQWGVYVTIPIVTAERAEIAAEVTLHNHTDSPADVQIALTLRDSAGAVVAQAQASVSVPSGGEHSGRCLLTLSQSRLWAVEQPELYTLRTELRRDGEVIDREDTSVGLRAFHFDADAGFFLNGQNLKLKGVCLHDDAGVLGTAVPPRVWERRLKTLKSAGVNAIRMAHNPHMPELYDLCDQLGFLVQDEAFDESELGKRKW